MLLPLCFEKHKGVVLTINIAMEAYNKKDHMHRSNIIHPQFFTILARWGSKNDSCLKHNMEKIKKKPQQFQTPLKAA